MEELIKYIISHLTDEPDKVLVVREGDNINVTVPKSDMGKIIGRQGRIAKAIRTIVKSASKDGERVNLEILEAEAAEAQA